MLIYAQSVADWNHIIVSVGHACSAHLSSTLQMHHGKAHSRPTTELTAGIDLSRPYLAHHELESIVIVITIITRGGVTDAKKRRTWNRLSPLNS